MRRRKAQKKLKRKMLTVCLKCPRKPFNPMYETKPWNMRARLVEIQRDVWVVQKHCLKCGNEITLY